MKKLFLVAALFLAAGTAAWASQNETTSPAVRTVADGEFTPIDVKDLPAAVVEAVERNFPGASLSEAAVRAAAAEGRVYRVSLVDREGAGRTVLFTESGELLPSEAPAPASEEEQDLPCTDEVLD